MLTLRLNDLGNYGCFLDCAEKQSQPLYTEATVNLIRRGPMSPLLKHCESASCSFLFRVNCFLLLRF